MLLIKSVLMFQSVLEIQEAEGYEFADPTPKEMSHVGFHSIITSSLALI